MARAGVGRKLFSGAGKTAIMGLVSPSQIMYLGGGPQEARRCLWVGQSLWPHFAKRYEKEVSSKSWRVCKPGGRDGVSPEM